MGAEWVPKGTRVPKGSQGQGPLAGWSGDRLAAEARQGPQQARGARLRAWFDWGCERLGLQLRRPPRQGSCKVRQGGSSKASKTAGGSPASELESPALSWRGRAAGAPASSCRHEDATSERPVRDGQGMSRGGDWCDCGARGLRVVQAACLSSAGELVGAQQAPQRRVED